MDVSFEVRVLKIKNSGKIQEIEHESEIGQVIVCDGKILIRYKSTGQNTPNNNILCLDSNGKTIWVAGNPGDTRLGRKFHIPRMFLHMFINQNNELWASGGQSDYKISLEDGEILDEVFTK